MTNLWRFMIIIIFFENMVFDAFLACLFNVHYLIFCLWSWICIFCYEYIWKKVHTITNISILQQVFILLISSIDKNSPFVIDIWRMCCVNVECSATFCPFFHISVTVQKSTQDRTIRAFIPAILLNLSLRPWLNIFVPWSWSLWIYVTLMTIIILTN